MSHCIHCDALRILRIDTLGKFCYDSSVFINQTETDVILKFRRIPHTTLNSDADTPTWCPRGLK